MLRWLSGKTIHCRLSGEGSVEISVAGTNVSFSPHFVSTLPDLSIEVDRKTLISLIEGKEKPSEAVFNGHLRVAGLSDDLVRIHDIFLDVVQLLELSSGLQVLYREFKRSRFEPLSWKVTVDFLGRTYRSGARSRRSEASGSSDWRG